MIAYYVYNSETRTDSIYLADKGCFFEVDRARMETFISTNPRFGNWAGDSCWVMPPREFGGVIALREEIGDLRILNPELWQERMAAHLGPQ